MGEKSFKRVSFGEERRQPIRSRAPIMKAAEGLQIPISKYVDQMSGGRMSYLRADLRIPARGKSA